MRTGNKYVTKDEEVKKNIKQSISLQGNKMVETRVNYSAFTFFLLNTLKYRDSINTGLMLR